MKKIFSLLVIMLVGINGFSQKNNNLNSDTSKMCIPYSVVQKILIDLNDYDKLKELSQLDKKEITQLNNKILFLQKENKAWMSEDSLNRIIISEKNEKIKIYEEENLDLKKENKRTKTKNVLFNIISAVIIAPLTYIAIFK
jgi:hypothetical protein